MLHDLQVHQIELELQNEELRRAQLALADSQARYFDLYELAPVGYVTVSESGLILEANLTACTLLGLARGEAAAAARSLLGQPFFLFIQKEDSNVLHLFHKQSFETGEPQACDVRMLKPDGTPFWVHLTATAAQDGAADPPVCRIVINDITVRKEAEVVARESELRYEAMVHSIDDAIISADSAGNIVNFNSAAERIFGYTEAEVRGQPVTLLQPAEAHDRHRAGMARVQSGGAPHVIGKTVELQGRRKDGREFPVLLSLSEWQVADKKFFTAVIRDITETKQAEEQLQRFFNLIPDLVCIASTDGYFRKINPAWSATLGYTEDELLARPFMDFIHPDDRDGTMKEVMQQLAGRQTIQFINRYCCKDGSYRWLEWRAAPAVDQTLLFAAARDITERKEAEAALWASEERYSLTLEALNDGLWDWSIPSGSAFFSPNYYSLLGYDDREFQACYASWRLLVHPEDLARVEEELRVSINNGEEFSIDLRMKLKSGQWRWVMTRGRVVEQDAEGKTQRMLGTLSDITERKKAEEALQSSLREKEALLNEVHHRVKNNLQVITSLLRLEEGRSEHPAAKSVLQEMGARILAMALLHESLYRSGMFGVVDLGAYLRELTNEAFRAQAFEPASIRLHQELGSILVGFDQAMPCGLLVNELLCNSLKHGFPEGGDGEVRIELQLVDGGPQVRLRVSDTGVGLPANFELKRVHSLGLQLVANLVRQLDGRLAIGPAPNAVFEVLFTPKPTPPKFSSPSP